MGPRVLCEEAGEHWIPVSQRFDYKRTLKAIERIYKVPSKPKSPVTINHLRKIASSLSRREKKQLSTATKWCAVLVGFWGFLRKGNYTSYNESSFDPDSDLSISNLICRNKRWGIILTKTKTIQFGEREVIIWLPRLQDRSICPSAAMDDMLGLRGELGRSEPLFMIDKKGTPLARKTFEKAFKSFFVGANIPTKNMSPHSLRRGGATYALSCGVSPTCIKLQGDWTSDAWMLYAWINDQLKEETLEILESKTQPCQG